MNVIIQTLNARAPDILRTMGLMELQITFLALVVLALDRWLQNSSPKIRYALWLMVLIKSLLPPVWQLSPADLPTPLVELPEIALAIASRSAQPEGLSPAGIILLIWLAASLSLLTFAILRFLSFSP